MTIGTRLKAELKRLGMNKSRFAEVRYVGKPMRTRSEKKECLPDASYLAMLAKASVDVLYVITGQRNPAMPGQAFLNPMQQALIARHGVASEADKSIIEGVARLAAQPFMARRAEGP